MTIHGLLEVGKSVENGAEAHLLMRVMAQAKRIMMWINMKNHTPEE